MTPFEYLGHYVVDRISGLKGYCNSVTERSSGLVQCGVQPKGDGEKYPEGYNLDPHGLYLGDQDEFPYIIPTPVASVPYQLGSELRSKLSKIKGKASSRTTWLNGCITYQIVTEVNKEGKFEEYLLQHNDAELIEEPKEKPVKSKTGGPASRVPRL